MTKLAILLPVMSSASVPASIALSLSIVCLAAIVWAMFGEKHS